MPDIVLYQYTPVEGCDSASPFCTKVHRALNVKGLSYEPRVVGSPAEMKRINPGVSKVPVLEVDGQLVTDSTRILEHLDAHHPDPPLFPKEGPLAGRVRLLEDWADESLYWFPVYHRWQLDDGFAVLAEQAFGSLPFPLRWFVPRVVGRQVVRQLHGQGIGRLQPDVVLAALEGHLDMLEALLADGGPYLAGETVTAADLAVFGPLQVLRTPTTPQTREALGRRVGLMEWLRQVHEATDGPHAVAPL